MKIIHSNKLLRITTVSMSFRLLLKGQLKFMSNHMKTFAVSSAGEELFELKELENTEPIAVEMERTPSPVKDLKSLKKLVGVIKSIKPDIVHTHTPKAGLLGMMAAYYTKVPIRLHTVAGLPWMESKGVKRKLLSAIERLTYRFSTHIYCNSFALKSFILSNKLIKSNKISVLGSGSSNGVDTEWYERSSELEEEARSLSINYKLENYKVILFIGRLVKDKGIEELVEAFSQLKNSGHLVKLLLVGPFEKERDPLSETVLELIENDPDIITTGYIKDIRPYLIASYVLAFPSYREGFPNVPMQAGAMELPSVVTDINGCNEIIEHNKNGLIIPPKNTEKLKESLHALINDEKLWKKLSSNAREMIVSRYDQKSLWEDILNEYKRHLENKRIAVSSANTESL